MVHDALHDLVLGQFAQHGRQLAVVRVPEFDARCMDGDEYEEFSVEDLLLQGRQVLDDAQVVGAGRQHVAVTDVLGARDVAAVPRNAVHLLQLLGALHPELLQVALRHQEELQPREGEDVLDLVLVARGV